MPVRKTHLLWWLVISYYEPLWLTRLHGNNYASTFKMVKYFNVFTILELKNHWKTAGFEVNCHGLFFPRTHVTHLCLWWRGDQTGPATFAPSPVLGRCKWHTILYKFTAYNITHYVYILQGDDHNKLTSITTHSYKLVLLLVMRTLMIRSLSNILSPSLWWSL